MNENNRNSERFVAYDYKDVTAKRDMEGFYADSYTSFGWKLDGATAPAMKFSNVTLKFKRDRKIRNKAELSRLQRKFESDAREIECLEKSKTARASVTAYTIGLIGTGIMAGAVFSYLGGMIPLMIILAVPAFVGWGVAYLIYNKIRAKRAQAVTPLIEKQYDDIYAVCEEAQQLLGA